MNREQRFKLIYAQVRQVPPGSVASYGQLAEYCGLARGARQVGHALKCLEAGSTVPWFRVLGSSGKISLPPDSDSYKRQVEALRAEGVLVSRGRVSMKDYRWQPDMDELLWGPGHLE